MRSLAAIQSGIRRVNRAPMMVVALWALTVAASLPLTLSVRAAVQDQLGASLRAGEVADGATYDWMSEFGDHASGVAATFGPTVIGFAAVLDNASAFVDNVSRPAVITATALGYVLLWTFLAGGIIDRFTRDEATADERFFAACGTRFPALIRLGIVAAIVYGALFGSLHPWLLDDVYERLIADVNTERTAFGIRVFLYATFLVVLGGVNLLFDMAKIRLVSERRGSAIGALRAALRFIRRRPVEVVAVYVGDVALFLLVLALYALVAPGAGSGGLWTWVGLAISQAYIVARVWVKLVFWGSEAALFLGPPSASGLHSALREAAGLPAYREPFAT